MKTPLKFTTTLALGASALCAAFLAPAPSGLGQLPPVGSPGGPSRPLVGAERQQWLRGREVYDRDFRYSDGLGLPEMNADSCRACHQDPAIGGAGGLELNVSRFGDDNGGAGPFVNLPGGQGLSKLFPPNTEGREEHISDPTYVYEQRQPPTTFGMGAINSIPEAAILANQDLADGNMDGIFGYARMVNVNGIDEVGRFGWKAQVPEITDFARDAMGNECGMTTTDGGRGFAVLSDADSVADPELPQGDLDDIVFFMSNLATPQRTGSGAPEVGMGELLFDSVGCATCHVPTLVDDLGADVNLYSNLLVHNVMDGSFRGMAEPGAPAGFYRTAPLWGIVDTAPYMHDGRAEDLRQAIDAHAGEALGVRNAYLALPMVDQEALLRFLEDL
ncbi:MAG: CxxC motif-containing protein (DUF1111 family) [Chlamydiales bacterium]|jgi:mono/diheme cytochrome c family protein